MTQLYSNNANSVLAAPLTSSDINVTLGAGTGMLFSSPADPDYELVTLHTLDYSAWEVVKVTSRTGDTLVVVRGWEGSPRIWEIGTYVTANVTKKTLEGLRDQAQSAFDTAQEADSKATQAQTDAGSAASAVQHSMQVAEFTATSTYVDDASGNSAKFAKATLATTLLRYRYNYIFSGDPSDNPENRDVAPIPFLGVVPGEQTRVLVFKNGVPQSIFYNRYSSTEEGLLPNDANHAGFVEIVSHRTLRFVPPLATGDRVLVMAPGCPWQGDYIDGSRYTTLYAPTGVSDSYLGGGYGMDGGGAVNTIQTFSWDTMLTAIMDAGTYSLSTSRQYGSGAATNRSSHGWFFGGGAVGTTSVTRFPWSPLAATVNITPFAVATSYGTSFSNGASAYICGFGPNADNNAIQRFVLGTEVASDTGVSTSGTTYQYPDAVTDDVKGYLFNNTDGGGSTGGWVQEYTIATDAITAPVSLGHYFAPGDVAVLFRSGHCFLWAGSAWDSILRYDLATGAVLAATRSFYEMETESNHDVICDGEYYALSTHRGLFASETEAVTREYGRTQTGAGTYIGRVQDPVGAFTDKWGHC